MSLTVVIKVEVEIFINMSLIVCCSGLLGNVEADLIKRAG